jgi:DNA-binding transcriptional LysR family regulator
MFVAVMEAGSFAAAARRLGTGSGQASKLVSRLERELGARLLNRTTRALSPTEEGQAYFERIRTLLWELDELEASINNSSGTPTGRLRLTVPATFGVTQLAPLFNEFAEQYPRIELDVFFSDRLTSLVDEGFDVAVRVGKPIDSSLIVRKLCDVHFVVLAADKYLDKYGAPTRPEELTERECIVDTNFREPFVWHFGGTVGETLRVDVTGRLRYSNTAACLAAAEAGLGIAYVPSFIAGASIRAGRVRPLLRAYADEPLGVFLVYPPGRHLATKVRTLIEFLVERFRGTPEWNQAL